MRPLLLVLALAALAPAAGQGLAQRAEADGPFADPGQIYDWIDEHRPMTGGMVVNPLPGAAPEPLLFVLDRDSTLWLQFPDGQTAVLDAYLPFALGRIVDQELKYSQAPAAGSGWGFEDGRLFLYLSSGLPLWSAVALAVLIPLAAVLLIAWLWRGLRLASERGAQLADSRRRLADSREAERMRLARDLHDGPLQDLQALRMQLGVLQRSGGGEDLGQAQDALLGVVRELRGVSEGLRPPVLGPFGLAAAIRALAGRARQIHPDVAFDLALGADGTRLAEGARIALYRIAQESVNNAAVHGRPGRIAITYAEGDAGVRLEIADDGAGFAVPRDLHALEADGHLGVAGMAERAESIGGTLAVEARPGQGTRVVVEAPASVFAPPSPAIPTPS